MHYGRVGATPPNRTLNNLTSLGPTCTGTPSYQPAPNSQQSSKDDHGDLTESRLAFDMARGPRGPNSPIAECCNRAELPSGTAGGNPTGNASSGQNEEPWHDSRNPKKTPSHALWQPRPSPNPTSNNLTSLEVPLAQAHGATKPPRTAGKVAKATPRRSDRIKAGA